MSLSRLEEIIRSRMLQGEMQSHTDDIWLNIESDLPKKERSRRKVALLLLLPFMIGGVLYTYTNLSQDQGLVGEEVVVSTEKTEASSERHELSVFSTEEQRQTESTKELKNEVKLEKKIEKTNNNVVRSNPISLIKKAALSSDKNTVQKFTSNSANSELESQDKLEENPVVNKHVSLIAYDDHSVAAENALIIDDGVDKSLTSIPLVVHFIDAEEEDLSDLSMAEQAKISWLSNAVGGTVLLSAYAGVHNNIGKLHGADMDDMDQIKALESSSYGLAVGKIKGNWKFTAGVEYNVSNWSVQDELVRVNQEQTTAMRAVMLLTVDGGIREMPGTITQTEITTKNYDVYSKYSSWRFPVMVAYSNLLNKWRYSFGAGLSFSTKDQLETYAHSGVNSDFNSELDPVKHTLIASEPNIEALFNVQLEHMITSRLGLGLVAQYQKGISELAWNDPAEIQLDTEQFGVALSVTRYW